MPDLDYIESVSYSGTISTTGATYNGTLPDGVKYNKSHAAQRGTNSVPVKLVKHKFTCVAGCSYNTAPTFSVSALEPWRYHILTNTLTTEPVWGKITSIEFEVWHVFTNNPVPSSQGDTITFTSSPSITTVKVDTSSGYEGDDDGEGAYVPDAHDESSEAIYGAQLSSGETGGGDSDERSILIKGEPGSRFSVAIQSSNGRYYNFDTGNFGDYMSIFSGIIPRDRDMPGLVPGVDFKRGLLVKVIQISKPTDGTTYALILNPDASTSLVTKPFVNTEVDEVVVPPTSGLAITPVTQVFETKTLVPEFLVTPIWTSSSGVTIPSGQKYDFLVAGQEPRALVGGTSIKKDGAGVAKDLLVQIYKVVRASGGMAIVAGDLNDAFIKAPEEFLSNIKEVDGKFVTFENGWVFTVTGLRARLESETNFSVSIALQLVKTGTKNTSVQLDLSRLITHS